MDEAISAAGLSAPAPRRNGVTSAFGRLIDLIFPPRCLACEIPVASTGSLCPSCWTRFHQIERPFCERLALPFSHDLGAGALSAEAIADPPPFDRLRAVAAFDVVSRQLVHGLKYRDRLDLASAMGGWMVRAGSDLAKAADVVVPIPLHRRRLWSRRFNQSALLGAVVAKRLGRPFAPAALKRVRPTAQQVGLTSEQRRINVRGAFQVAADRRMDVAGRRVLLIDDVYTTGATAKAATRTLLRAGALAVDVLVFARVIRE